MKVLKVLVYGDIDLNFMDGSAVWLVSFVKMLTQNKNITVDLLVKAPEKNSHLISSLKNIKNLNLVQPYEENRYSFISPDRLDVLSAAKIMESLDKRNNYHVICTRGQQLALELINYAGLKGKTVPYITDFQHDEKKSEVVERKALKKIYNHYNKLFLQTEEAKLALKKLLGVSGNKVELLYPMVPNIEKTPNYMNKKNRVVYAGKFHENWYTEETIDIAQEMNYSHPKVEFLVIGDKFQDRLRDKEKQQTIKEQLRNTENIKWMGAISREQTQDLIADSDVGIAWRSPELDNDDSVELSCKLLEYARLGKPTLIRRTKIHEAILGKDYPLFVDSKLEFEAKLVEVLTDNLLYKQTAKRIFSAVHFFTFSEAYNRLHTFFWSYYPEKTKIVFAGHDLKFASLIIESFKKNDAYEVMIDKWESHEKHDEKHSLNCLAWADVIFCEWGLGNSVWYSKNKREEQKLIVRLHFQEKDLKFLSNCNVENVNQFIVITPYMMEEFHRIFKIPRSKMIYIDNLVKKEMFTIEKESDIQFNLGIIGILPARKRLDIAVDLFEELWQEDNRYRLYVKGKLPQEVNWLMARESERKYYDNLMSRIYKAPWRRQVVFDSHGNDVDEWFKKIGHLLSTSDYEGSHVAISEAMASGTHPVIRNWKGATTIYPQRFIHETKEEMSAAVKNFEYSENIKTEMSLFAKHKFIENRQVKLIEQLINQLYREEG